MILFPWQDRRGRFDPLKAMIFACLFLPGIVLAGEAVFGDLGPRPLNGAIHTAGLWAIRFLFLSLAISPLRLMLRWGELISVRRMLGVAAFAYAALHLGLYAADQGFNLRTIGFEIVHRLYLTIGAVALLGLTALAATSTDGMVRRLGAKRWRLLHRLSYGIVILATIHYFMQSKLNVAEPTIFAGLVLWLFVYRLLVLWLGEMTLPRLAILGAATALLTGTGEALGFHIFYHVPFARILHADFSLRGGLRPGWIVLLIMAGIVLVTAARRQRPNALT